MMLATVVNLLLDGSNEAAEEGVAALREAAADAGGSAAAAAAAVARGAPDAALGADLTPPAATADAPERAA